MSEYVNLTGTDPDNDLMLCTVTETGYHFQPGWKDAGGTLQASPDCLPTYVTRTEIAQLPEVQALIAGMRRHEWWASDFGDCPSCEACEGDGHKPNCQWVVAMAPFEEITQENADGS